MYAAESKSNSAGSRAVQNASRHSSRSVVQSVRTVRPSENECFSFRNRPMSRGRDTLKRREPGTSSVLTDMVLSVENLKSFTSQNVRNALVDGI